MKEFTLYSYFRSSASYRVRIALNLKGIDYDYKAVHLINGGGEQHNEDYRKLNPSREVPTLIHEGKILGQSMAIIDYLDRVRPTPRLFPDDPYQRALVVQVCEIVNSGVQPVHNLRVLAELGKRFGADQAQRDDWAAHWINYGLETLETVLKAHAGTYCFGNEPTAADCFLVPQLANANRFKVSLDRFPTLQRLRAMMQTEPFRKAAPDVQPDTPAAAT